jgi:hypothetical protein
LELQINQDYRIRTDEYNIILEKSRIPETGNMKGQIVWDTMGYYPDFDWAFRAMIKCNIFKSDLRDIESIIATIDSATHDIKECLSEANLKRLDKQMRSLALENELLKKKLNKEGDEE